MRKTLIAALILASATVQAQETPAPSGWQTWTWEGACFAVLFPEEGAIAALDSDTAYLGLRHFPADGTRDAIAIVSGLEDVDGLSGRADVDGRIHDLLVFKGAGFVSSGPREQALLADMLAGEELKITWTTASGMNTQTYRLQGMTQAKRTIDTACFPQDD